jgi:HEAT repeat protein
MTGTSLGESDIAGVPQLEMFQVIEGLGDPNWRVRRKSIELLADNESDEVVEQLVSVLRHKHRELPRLNAAIQALARMEADVVPPLLRLMADSSAEVRSYAALALGERGDASAIPGLLVALHDVDSNVQVQAIESLGKLRASAAVEVLAEYATSQDFVLAFPALDALASIGDSRIAHRLLPLMRNPLLTIAAIDALGALGDEEAVAELVAVLDQNDVPVAPVVSSLARIQRRQSNDGVPVDAIPHLVRSAVESGRRARLLSAIPDDSSATSVDLLEVLSWLPGDEIDAFLRRQLLIQPTRQASKEALVKRGPTVIPSLLLGMAEQSPEVQVAIAEICASIGDQEHLAQLLASLDLNDESVAAPALRALARLGDHRLYPIARDMLGHSSEAVRQAAIAVINTLGDQQVCHDMVQFLQSPSALVRESAVTIASYAGFDETRDLLAACCRDPEERVRKATVQHLPCLDDAIALPNLRWAIEHDTPRVRAAAAGAVAELNDQAAARQLLLTTVGDEDAWVRYFAVRSLGKLEGVDDAVPLLTTLAQNDPTMHVRIASIEALGTLMALPMSLFDELGSAPDNDVRHAAIASLSNCGTMGAATRLLAVATDDRSKDRLPAIRALGLMGDSDSIPTLLKIAESRNELLADESIQALGQMRSGEAAAALIRVLEVPSRRAAAITALTNLGEVAISALAHGLQHAEIDVQRAIVEVLSGIWSHLSTAVLETVLESQHPSVRYATIRALNRIEFRQPVTGKTGNL